MMSNALKPFPKTVLISCIEYSIQEHEGLIVFTQTTGCWGTYSRMSFHKPKYALWQFKFYDSSDDIAVTHIIGAYEIICQYRGDEWGKYPSDESQSEGKGKDG